MTQPNVKTKTIWKPLEGSQTLLMNCPCNHILNEGTRGPGKTDGQVMYFRSLVGLGYDQFMRGIIFDREYKNLDDLIAKTLRWFPQFNDGAKFISSNSALKWVWPTGEELLFRVFKTEKDYWAYHGQEFPFIGWNELTKHPNSNGYDAMMSCNRSSFLPKEHTPERIRNLVKDENGNGINYLPEIPLRVLSTTNPYGVGHNWVKQRFIDPAPPGKVVKITKNVFNPRTQKREDITKTQVRIFGSYKENRYLSPEYVLELESIKDENKRRAWLWGDWDITAGGMFDDIWDSQYNIIDGFKIPDQWRMFRSFDWGSSKPFSVGWWTESDGSDVQLRDGTWKSTVKGDLFRIAEWYGWDGTANTGLRMLAKDVAKGILEREKRWGILHRVKAGPADSSIFDTEDGNCIAENMKAVGLKGADGKTYYCTWIKADKTPGSRKNGWELMRIAMAGAHPSEHGYPREDPGLFCFRNCQDGFIRTVPTLPRSEKDPDDVDTDAEDHCGDESRYVILHRKENFKTISTIGMTS